MIGMMILRIPYAPMIGALVGVTALIPIVGAFVGTIVGAVMIPDRGSLQSGSICSLSADSAASGGKRHLSQGGRIENQAAGHLGACSRYHWRKPGRPPLGMLLGVPAASAAYALMKEATDLREQRTFQEVKNNERCIGMGSESSSRKS